MFFVLRFSFPVVVRFTPKWEKEVNFNVVCNVKRKMLPLTLNVKAEGYSMNCLVLCEDSAGNKVELSSTCRSQVNFGCVTCCSFSFTCSQICWCIWLLLSRWWWKLLKISTDCMSCHGFHTAMAAHKVRWTCVLTPVPLHGTHCRKICAQWCTQQCLEKQLKAHYYVSFQCAMTFRLQFCVFVFRVTIVMHLCSFLPRELC